MKRSSFGRMWFREIWAKYKQISGERLFFLNFDNNPLIKGQNIVSSKLESSWQRTSDFTVGGGSSEQWETEIHRAVRWRRFTTIRPL